MEVRRQPEGVGALVERARGGDREALEELVRGVQDDVYNLAVRMLWLPEDAEDATQEILLRVVTHLGSFRGESAFRTWVYRIASNHLRDVRKSASERREMTFGSFGARLHEQNNEWLEQHAAEPGGLAVSGPDRPLLLEELRLGCTHAMLLCLPREQRVALILADVFQVSSEEGAAILDISPPAFRKRASRAREAMRGFLHEHCGLVNPAAFCRCEHRLGKVLELGMIDPEHLRFGGRGKPPDRSAGAATIQAVAQPGGHVAPLDRAATVAAVADWDELDRAAAVYRDAPRYPAPQNIVHALRALLDSGRHRLLN